MLSLKAWNIVVTNNASFKIRESTKTERKSDYGWDDIISQLLSWMSHYCKRGKATRVQNQGGTDTRLLQSWDEQQSIHFNPYAQVSYLTHQLISSLTCFCFSFLSVVTFSKFGLIGYLVKRKEKRKVTLLIENPWKEKGSISNKVT